jgi:3-oxoadipate enol-lactonase
VTEHFWDRHGICYRTNRFEPGRRTLVFMHGVSGSSSAWRPYEARFSPHYNIVTYDLRGHGKSRKYARLGDYAVDRFLDDLTALLDHLCIERCTVIGHSFATLLTLELLRRHRDRVEGAVLASADFDVGRTRRGRLLEAILKPVGVLDYLPFRPGLGAHVDYARFPQTGDWNLPRMAADIGNTTWRVYLYASRQIYAVHADSILMSIQVPILLVHGKRDSIFPVEHARYMAARIPHARLVVLEEADHIVVLNHPDAVGTAIQEFLEGPLADETAAAEFLRAKPPAQVHETAEDAEGNAVLHDAKGR